MTKLPRSLGLRQRELIVALRTLVPPKLPDYDVEREMQAQSRGPVRAGWDVHHQPENGQFVVWGTLDRQRVLGPFVSRYGSGYGLSRACDDMIDAVRRLTGEGYTEVLLSGNRQWFGPMG